ncbi:unnamed protein product [Heligmosomoides polygyrus]|uniref:Transposase n=1 Tax=Heligmosomoides polygyrus TaxID=6339 RepID=A0A183FRZ0_HELPZ|nr:unnamed protein product [Heligmosomoides polygyrus]
MQLVPNGTLWRECLCEKKIPERLKSKVYRAVVRLIGACIMETKMLQWRAGVTPLDRVRNGYIRQGFGVTPIVDKLREARLKAPQSSAATPLAAMVKDRAGTPPAASSASLPYG